MTALYRVTCSYSAVLGSAAPQPWSFVPGWIARGSFAKACAISYTCIPRLISPVKTECKSANRDAEAAYAEERAYINPVRVTLQQVFVQLLRLIKVAQVVLRKRGRCPDPVALRKLCCQILQITGRP